MPETSDTTVYVDMCDAWVPQAVAERMVPLILEAVDRTARPKAAAAEIDARLTEELGADWTGGPQMIQRGLRRLRTSNRATALAKRIVPRLDRVTPSFIRPALTRGYRLLARYLASAKYRRRYGREFVWEIHADDDLLHYALDVAAPGSPLRYFRAVQMYFEGGAWNAANVETALRDAGFSLRDASSMLEFASGYGRLTRHLMQMLDRSKITVSDIDFGGVDFSKQRFGVNGFYSAPTAGELDHGGRYELIVVVSLFSHLPIEQWGPWLERLGGMLSADGVLLFSVGGQHAWSVNVSDADRATFEQKAEGFLYAERNETRGRLAGEKYGIAYVSEDYVRQAVGRHFHGRLVKACPRGLNGFQDVYVLARGG